MDNASKVILSVIALALCVIAFKLWLPSGTVVGAPTYGDFNALRDIHDPQLRKEARLRLMNSIPLVRVQGGQIDADVTGNVSID